jgi:hypothetical protein
VLSDHSPTLSRKVFYNNDLRHFYVPFVDQTEARNLLLGYFETNRTLAKSRPIAPPQSEDAVEAGADNLQEGVLGPFQVAGS